MSTTTSSSSSSLTSLLSSLEQLLLAWGYPDSAAALAPLGLGRVIGRLLKQITWCR